LKDERGIDRSAIVLDLFCIVIEKRPATPDSREFAKDVRLLSQFLLCRLHRTILKREKLLENVEFFRCAMRTACFKTRNQWFVAVCRLIKLFFPIKKEEFECYPHQANIRLICELAERDKKRKGDKNGEGN